MLLAGPALHPLSSATIPSGQSALSSHSVKKSLPISSIYSAPATLHFWGCSANTRNCHLITPSITGAAVTPGSVKAGKLPAKNAPTSSPKNAQTWLKTRHRKPLILPASSSIFTGGSLLNFTPRLMATNLSNSNSKRPSTSVLPSPRSALSEFRAKLDDTRRLQLSKPNATVQSNATTPNR